MIFLSYVYYFAVMFDILFITISLIAFDAIWFSMTLTDLYKPAIQTIQSAPMTLRPASAIIAWSLLAIGIKYFVLAQGRDMDHISVISRGAILGAVVYGVYNATNYATLARYPLKMAVADTIWGVVTVSAVSLLAAQIL